MTKKDYNITHHFGKATFHPPTVILNLPAGRQGSVTIEESELPKADPSFLSG